jgi:hypothetical protein
MATYFASEKDVRYENDELQECVICLGEFEVGEELALLECFCKFHKVSSYPAQRYEGSTLI